MVRQLIAPTLALTVIINAYVRGDDAPPPRPKKAAPAAKTEEKQVTEENVTVPDGSPKDLRKIIESAMRSRADATESAVNRMRRQVFTVLKAADKLLAHPESTDADKKLARHQKLQALFQGTRLDEAIFGRRLTDYVQKLTQDAPGSDEAALGNAYVIYRTVLNRPTPSADVIHRLTDFAKTYPQSPVGGQLFAMYSRQLESEGKPTEAVAVLRAGVESYKTNRAITESLESSLRRLDIIGKPMEIAGPTLTGSQFNLTSLKGKVVLVDFWATWCGPCRGEIPGVKAIYDKYHKKGFEVVAVSLDEDKSALEKYIADNKLPWTQIFFEDAKDQGWKNPLAKKYGIDGIPAMFLIDRSGRVAHTSVRGEKAIEKAVIELLSKPAQTLAN